MHIPLNDELESYLLLAGSTIFTMSRIRSVRKSGWEGSNLAYFYTLLGGALLGFVVEV